LGLASGGQLEKIRAAKANDPEPQQYFARCRRRGGTAFQDGFIAAQAGDDIICTGGCWLTGGFHGSSFWALSTFRLRGV
jgi:hypothetical protein